MWFFLHKKSIGLPGTDDPRIGEKVAFLNVLKQDSDQKKNSSQ